MPTQQSIQRLHPWEVPDAVANKHVLSALKKLAFRRYRGEHESTTRLVQGLERAANNSTWQTAVMEQTPKKLWAHNNELTEY
jgi:cytochrome c551/c552